MPYIIKNVSIPLPVLSIHIGRPGERPLLGPLTGLVDTGADMTILPIAFMNQLKLGRYGKGRLFGQWGEPHSVGFYLIEMEVGGLRFTNIQIAADDVMKEVVLGRNVLNKLPLFLDGLQQHIEILDDATVNRLRNRRKLA